MAKKSEEKKDTKQAALDDRARALETTLVSLEKQFGKGTVMKLGDQTHMKVDAIPTGCLELDMALGVGGIPKGRITEQVGVIMEKTGRADNLSEILSPFFQQTCRARADQPEKRIAVLLFFLSGKGRTENRQRRQKSSKPSE